MRFVAELRSLEVFFAWDAHNLSDAGVQHLQGLQSLREIHINESKIGDGSLEVFGGLPNLEDLSIQQNHFTNAGLVHLTRLKHLRELWIGMNDVPYSDDAMLTLSQLATLEKLDLQSSVLTDAGIQHLAKLQSLRVLLVEGAPTHEAETITDASVSVLVEMPFLEDLTIRKHSRITDEGMHKLAAMPTMKQIMVDSTEARGNIDEELERLYPGLEVR
ncbi:MAG: hypothetical protein KDA52_20295 [Planctomycetaceae bacterium]|nr:hypothetical protein [Planctomycetaceae bacterium]